MLQRRFFFLLALISIVSVGTAGCNQAPYQNVRYGEERDVAINVSISAAPLLTVPPAFALRPITGERDRYPGGTTATPRQVPQKHHSIGTTALLKEANVSLTITGIRSLIDYETYSMVTGEPEFIEQLVFLRTPSTQPHPLPTIHRQRKDKWFRIF